MKNDDKPKAKPGRPAKARSAKESTRAPRGESAADNLPPIDFEAPSEAVKPGAQPAEPLLVVPPEKRVRIGITGEPGAGKSALARQLGALGGTVIDVDRLGHELLEHPRIKRDLARAFGEDILTGDGDVDRRALAAKAFANAESTATLNGIMHPPLAARAKALAAKAGNFVVIDAGLLHEIGLGEDCTISIYVKANRDNRVNRVAERGWDEGELARREQALGDADARRKKCNLAVDNTGDPNLLAAYAKTILARQIGLDLAALKKQAPMPVRVVDNGNDNHDQEDDSQDTTNDASQDGDAGDQSDRASQPEPQQRRDQQRPGDRRFDQRGNPQQQNRQGGQQRDGGNQRDGNQQGGQQGNGQPGNQDNRPPVKMVLDDYLRRTLPDLQGEADKLEVRDVKWLKKHDLICEILRRVAAGRADEIVVEGYIELIKDQQAYIRSPLNNYLPVNTDAFIANPQIRRYGLKAGMQVAGLA
ncbi:MAG TPA: dephospho-CoA kinase, partial [Planctomycetota bacterium]|nr:dephospho-CoA kinase [Planctomycetota bacterium]